MNEHDEDPLLVAIATTIADGHPVDWEHQFAAHPELTADLEALRQLEALEAARRNLAAGRPPRGR